ncbi:probable gluconokinase [[Candida] railenensis]|uniref:Gluconokinase n=1 Tax=[Candida] railenensis TaxID=45579 RepID=A0A9P0QQJ1_9ASCO|nr:probable gluconokinase [[Candida] railenensis]
MKFIVVGGPAGTGKTTLGEKLSEYLGCPYIEGDSLHPKENIDKMSKGIALTDEDRWGWLQVLSEITVEKASQSSTKTAIVSCSMLKKIYRRYIEKCATAANQTDEPIEFRFVFLHTTFEELMKRVGGRQGHYMKSDMVMSQYNIMEVPKDDELLSNGGNCLEFDTTGKDPEKVFTEVSEIF